MSSDEFWSKHGTVIPIGVTLRVRYGYEFWLDYIMINQCFFVVYLDDGWSFVTYPSSGRNVFDEIVPPFYFFENLALMFPDRVEFVVSYGHHIIGSYCRSASALTGLGSIGHMPSLLDSANITDLWDTKDSFTAYHQHCCWRIQIKKRRDWKKIVIHDDWIQFRNDMDLSTGDVCVF
ncbi:hypothetical protein POM88_031550 [Heracleum sosnowskyi]|uniref:TF-B3 domain-containing protein n=1 Tax=Heracleum sosnowskyi TaxID=360622 RepID=A0AAD8HZM2_9APIA|nr:hypothetical protein POM88_031550 [Heracleum sosnowskyi]